MNEIEKIKKDLEEIHKRDKLAETDHAWEQSYTRRMIALAFTYLLVVVFMQAADLPDPWKNAFVPTLAYVITNQTLPLFKNLWRNYIYRHKGRVDKEREKKQSRT